MPHSPEDELMSRLKARLAHSAEIEPSFWDLAAEFRTLTDGRKSTPSEVLIREGRDER